MSGNQLGDVKQIIAVHSAKGGVGKSTLTTNLAVGLAATGAKVGFIDADVHGPSATIMLGNADWPDPGETEDLILPLEAHGVKFISMGNLVTPQTPLIWRGAMVHSVVSQFLNNVAWGELDYLFIDMPPGTGDALISLAQAVPLAGVVTISTPQELSLTDTIRGLRSFQQLEVPVLGMVENMSFFVCDGCNETSHIFGASGAQMLAEELGVPFLGRVPLEAGVCLAGDEGKPIIISQPDSSAGRGMAGIVRRLTHILAEQQPVNAFDLKWRDLGWDTRITEPPNSDDVNQDLLVRAIWQVSTDELGIQWGSGGAAIIALRKLRQACPCAACVEEWSGAPLLDPNSVPADIKVSEIRSVGRYAINPRFTDGHSSGIFHFAKLKALAEKKH